MKRGCLSGGGKSPIIFRSFYLKLTAVDLIFPRLLACDRITNLLMKISHNEVIVKC